VNSLKVRLPQVLDWLASAKPDALALQETKLKDANFPADDFTELGYASSFSGQAAYNGVALISREPCAAVVTEIAGFGDEQRRVLAATVGGIRIYNLYVPNGQSVGSDKYRYKLDWLEALKRQVARELAANTRLILLGDFNVAPEDRDVHDPEAWRGKVLCSEPEREALRSLLGLGLSDVFRRFDQAEKSFSWWDYRAAAFRRNRGLRIDLILASEPLAVSCTACRIDLEPRRAERPSDHTPVVAEFASSGKGV
jgi:exodeoxyribonuclease-3